MHCGIVIANTTANVPYYFDYPTFPHFNSLRNTISFFFFFLIINYNTLAYRIHHNTENLASCRALWFGFEIICDNKSRQLPRKQVLSPDYISDTYILEQNLNAHRDRVFLVTLQYRKWIKERWHSVQTSVI